MNGLETEGNREAYVKGLVEELERVKGDKEAEAAVRQALADVGEEASPPAKRASRRPAKKGAKRA